MADRNKLAKALINYVEMPGRQLNAFFGAKPSANPLAAARALKQVGGDILGSIQSAYTAPGRALSGQLDPNSPEGMQEAMNFALNFMGAGSAPAINKPMQHGSLGITAWHGSPYKFEKFDASKIGSGEGNQVYSHGLYFAEHPKVAQGYQERLADAGSPTSYMWNGNLYEGGIKGDPISHALGLTYYNNKNLANKIAKQGLEDAKKGEAYALDFGGVPYYEKMIDVLKSLNKKDIKATQGSLYKVDIADETIPKMLDWDKPLSKQNEFIQNITSNEIKNIGGSATTGSDFFKEMIFDERMKALDKGLRPTEKELNVLATNRLKDLGISGMKYLDAGSRGVKTGTTSNYVVYDPETIKILERNGLLLP